MRTHSPGTHKTWVETWNSIFKYLRAHMEHTRAYTIHICSPSGCCETISSEWNVVFSRIYHRSHRIRAIVNALDCKRIDLVILSSPVYYRLVLSWQYFAVCNSDLWHKQWKHFSRVHRTEKIIFFCISPLCTIAPRIHICFCCWKLKMRNERIFCPFQVWLTTRKVQKSSMNNGTTSQLYVIANVHFRTAEQLRY